MDLSLKAPIASISALFDRRPYNAGSFEVEGLRLHYARTCRQWVERLCARADEARALAGERTYRTWRLYLTCSAVAFEGGSLGLYQVLMRKHRDPVIVNAPRTRAGAKTRTARRGTAGSEAG